MSCQFEIWNVKIKSNLASLMFSNSLESNTGCNVAEGLKKILRQWHLVPFLTEKDQKETFKDSLALFP